MLLRFRMANHRSIRSEHTLSFVATEFNEGTAIPTGVRAERQEIRLIPALGIFGSNASGKTNVLAGLQAMREAVRTSLAEWAQGAGVPRDPFALDPTAAEETTLFEVDLLLGESPVRYTYGFELSDDRVEAEWLHAYPHGRKQVWFDREADRADGDDFSFPGDGLKGDKERLAGFTRSNSLFLTVAASLNHPQCTVIHRWFLTNLCLLAPRQRTGWTLAADHTVSTRRLLMEARDPERAQRRIEALLRIADLGIAGLSVDRTRAPDRQIELLHHTAAEPMPLDFERQESLGTNAWFDFLGPLLDVLDHGSVLLVDELDASLHPTLAAEVIRLFHDPAANKRRAQLVFTTHDATLLGSALVDRPLDRDQVWITSKDPTGATELYPLIDARPRKDENLERGYLRGRYGGAPRLTSGELAREVTHILAEAV
jgi:hypothetical protein